MDPHKNPGSSPQHDGSPIEFYGNTPTGGRFASPWSLHGWTADPQHSGDSGFKIKKKSIYDDDGAPDDEDLKEKQAKKRLEREAMLAQSAKSCAIPDDDDDDE